VSVEEASFHPSGEGGRERLHPAVFTLVLAYLRDLNALTDSKRLRSAYGELGFSIGDRQLRNHRKWLLERGYIEVRVTGEGRRVELTEKGLKLLRALGLLKEVRA
jgi:repressor of nif and glnA expression